MTTVEKIREILSGIIAYIDDHPASETAAEMSKSGWISVKDRLPEEKGTYLVFAPTYHGGSSSGLDCNDGIMFARWKKHWSIEVGCHKIPNCVTHWMPLPEPPKEEENDQ